MVEILSVSVPVLREVNSCLEQKQVLAGRCHGLTQDPVTHTLYTLQAVFRIRILNAVLDPRKSNVAQKGINFAFYELVASLEGAKGFS